MIPFCLAIDGVEIALGSKNEIFAVSAETGRWRVIPFLCYRIFFARSKMVYIDHRHVVLARFGISNPLAVGRVIDWIKLFFRVLHDSFFGFWVDIYFHDTVFAVGVEHFFAVRTPHQLADVGVVVFSQLDRFSAFGGLQPDFSFSGPVADIGDVFSVRAPNCIALVGPRSTSNVAGYSFICRNIKHFAASSYRYPVSVGRKTDCSQISPYFFHFLAGKDIIRF